MEPLHHHFEEMVVYAGNVCSQGGRMNGIRRDELDRGICGCQVRGGIAAMGVLLWGLIHGSGGDSFMWPDPMEGKRL